MVGVPRSKTCFRCLDKRKRCDSRRPGCGRCEKRGVECPGYRARYRFVSPSGADVDGQSTDEVILPLIKTSEPATVIQSNAAGAGDPFYRSLQGTASQIELLARFHDIYYPRHRFGWKPLATDLDDLPSWEWILLTLANSVGVPLLADVALALVLGCVGRRNLNTEYLHTGMALHARAVGRLKKQLQHEQGRCSDEVLAAVMVFGIYEIQVGSFSRGRSWLAHVHGVDALLQFHGYSEERSPLAKQLIWASQYNRWVIAMRTRGSIPPLLLQSMSKERLPPDIQLLEILQSLAPLIAKVDRFLALHGACCPHTKSQLSTSLLLDIKSFEDRLHNCCSSLSNLPDSALYWNEPSILRKAQPPTALELESFASMVCFPSIRIATSLLFYWTGLLFLHTSKDLLDIASGSGSLSTSVGNETALRIAKSLEYFLHPDIGLFGTYLIGYPLAVSRAYFEQQDMHDALLWLGIIEARINEVSSGLVDFLKAVKADNLLPRLVT